VLQALYKLDRHLFSHKGISVDQRVTLKAPSDCHEREVTSIQAAYRAVDCRWRAAGPSWLISPTSRYPMVRHIETGSDPIRLP
jgi:hypothetical protein